MNAERSVEERRSGRGLSFVDSNVIVYLFEPDDLRKREIATAIVGGAVRSRDACISFQVVQEALNTVIRKGGLSAEGAGEFLRDVLVPLWQVMPSQALYLRSLDILDRYGFSFYDCVVIASALEAGCSELLTEDLQDGQCIEGLTIRNPFAT